MSPILFNIYMMGMVEELERARQRSTGVGLICIADDIVLVVDSRMELHTMLEVVQTYMMRWRWFKRM